MSYIDSGYQQRRKYVNRVDIKGTGELSDEFLTLCFRFLSTGEKRSFKRAKLILKKILQREGQSHRFLTLHLALANSLCWLSQENIMKSDKDSLRWARMAQKANKFRNKIMGKLNDNVGIITSKTY